MRLGIRRPMRRQDEEGSQRMNDLDRQLFSQVVEALRAEHALDTADTGGHGQRALPALGGSARVDKPFSSKELLRALKLVL